MFFHIFPHMLSGINPAYMTTYHIFVISYHSVIVTTNITNGKKKHIFKYKDKYRI
jgi:hypothetical protein